MPGDYDVSLNILASGAATSQVYINGVATYTLGVANSASRSMGGSLIIPNLAVGTTISFRSVASVTVTVGNVSIALRQSSQQIAASERISFHANTSSTAATTASPFVYTVVEDNTHGAYNVSTGKFTAPAPGMYHFTANLISTVAADYIRLYKNGSLKILGNTYSGTLEGFVSGTIPLVVGDIIDIRPGINTTANGSATGNFFSGFRVGGV